MNTLQTLRRSGLDFKYTPACDACRKPAIWFGKATCCADSGYACELHKLNVDRMYRAAHRERRGWVHSPCGRSIDESVRIEWMRVLPC